MVNTLYGKHNKKCFACIQVGCPTEKFVCRIHFTVILRHYNMGVK